MNSVLLRSIPFSRRSELLDISARSAYFDFTSLGLSLPDIADLRNSSKSLAALAVYQDSPKELAVDKPRHLEATAVSKDFFLLLGLGPIHGRTFTSEDMQPGSRSVILSYSLWRDTFAADAAVLGRTVTLDAQPYTIIGVMAAEPALGFATDSKLFTPFIATEEQLADRGNHAYSVIARLRPHSTVAQVQSELDTISARLASAYPDVSQGWSIHATPLKQYLLGDARTPLANLLWTGQRFRPQLLASAPRCCARVHSSDWRDAGPSHLRPTSSPRPRLSTRASPEFAPRFSQVSLRVS